MAADMSSKTTTISVPEVGSRVRRHLTDELASQLQAEIISGKRKPGERLPTEQEIAKRSGVSRAVVREAISRLKQDGLVETRQGLGAFVSRSGQSSAFRIGPDVSRKELALIFQLRTTLEVEAAGLAAELRSARQLKSMREALAHIAQAIERGDDGSEPDAAFHQSIAKASGNHYFSDFMQFLESRIHAAIGIARLNSARHEGWGEKVQLEHKRIYDMVAAGSSDGARAAMRHHLVSAATRLGLADALNTRRRRSNGREKKR
jgi:GntR family transcriptional repressor for pyruvate dehydrogenase complex